MRALVGAGLAVLLVTGACGGSDDAGRAGSAAVTTSTTRMGSSTVVAVPDTQRPSTSAGTGRSTAPAGSGAAGAAGTTTTGGTPPAPAAGLAFATPGTYRYSSTGRFSSTLGGPQMRDGESTLTVGPPSGTDQHSVRQSPGRTADQVLRLDRGGAYLVSLRLVEQGFTKEVRPSPPALALPAGAAPGRTWAWRATSTDGRTTIDSSFTAARTEGVTVGAETVTALVVDVVLTLTGDVVASSRQTLWVSQHHSLVVRQDDATEGSLGAIAFSSTSSDRLLSLRPS